jgi:transposase-like protein
MAGRCPDDKAQVFAADTLELSTRELAKKYGIAISTIKDWRQDARERLGLEVGYGTGQESAELQIEGLGPGENREEIWQKAFLAQERAEVVRQAKDERRITLPNEPCALVVLSDIHFGDPETDHKAARRDAEIVRDTEGMYALFNGDGVNNWIVEKLMSLQRSQALTFREEMTLFVDWLEILGDDLKVVIDGNHEHWTEKLAGIPLLATLLKGKKAIVDAVFNPTHGQEVGWERGDDDYDIALGGHTHIGTLCRPFYRHNRKRWAVLTGTYKVGDGFGRSLGFPSPKGRGCGALLFHPDGRMLFVEDLETAAEFLAFWRQ